MAHKQSSNIVNTLQEVLSVHKLGNLVAKPKKLSGGYTHHVWYVKTKDHEYVIKQLNSIFTANFNYLLRYRQSQMMANQLAQNDFPVNYGLTLNDEPIQQINNQYYIVLPYIDGHILSDKKITEDHVRVVAKLLKNLHDRPVTLDKTHEMLPISVDIQTWDKLYHQVIAIHHKTHKILDTAWTMIEFVNDHADINIALRERDPVLSHGDLDVGNVIWTRHHQPIVIDWEWSGVAYRGMDCWATALNWSRLPEGRWNPDRVRLFWQEYGEINNIYAEQALIALCGYWCEWIGWMMRELIEFKPEPRVANNILITLARIERLYQHRDEILSWI